MRATIQYTVIRLALFAAVTVILVLLQFNGFLAAAIAAVASFLISYFLFTGLRGKMALELAARGTRNSRDEVITKDRDTDAEDEALDRADADRAGTDRAGTDRAGTDRAGADRAGAADVKPGDEA